MKKMVKTIRSAAHHVKMPVFATIVVGVVSILFFIALSFFIAQDTIAKSRIKARAISSEYAHSISNSIEIAGSTCYSVDLFLSGRGSGQSNFSIAADKVMSHVKGVSSIGFAPQGIVSWVYPVEEKDAFIGKNILNEFFTEEDDRPMRTRNLMIIGPHRLNSGMNVIIALYPVFSGNSNSTFLGFVFAIVELDQILKSINIEAVITQGYDYCIWNNHTITGVPSIISSSTGIIPNDSELSHIVLYNSDWSLGITKRGGWIESWVVILLAGASILFALTLTGFAFFLFRGYRRKHLLNTKLEEEIEIRFLREEELLASEYTFRALLNSISESVMLVNKEGFIIEANAVVQDRIGLPFEYKGINVFDYLPEQNAKRRKESLEKASQTKSRVSFTDINYGRTIKNEICPVIEPDGSAERFAIFGYDITDLRRNEALLSNIISTAPVGILVVNSDGQISMANEYAESILGLSKRKIEGRAHNDNEWRITSINGDPYPLEDLPFYRVMNRDEPVFNVEYAIEPKEGVRIFLSINAAPLHDAVNAVQGVVMILSNITDRRMIMYELAESNKRTRAIIESINDGFFALDKHGCFSYVNHRAEDIWNIANKDIIGRNFSEVFSAELYPLAFEKYKQVFEGESNVNFELYDQKNEHWYMFHLYPFTDGTSAFFTDITDRKVMEEKLYEFAHFDALTHVYNRRAGISLLQKEILKCRREKTELTICFIDADGLKCVNDNYGHAEGDWLILTIADSLVHCLRGSDSICRMGGDEFLIILPSCEIDVAKSVVARARARVKEFNIKSEKPYEAMFSEGYAVYPAESSMTADEFIREADSEMYRAKTARRVQRK